MTNRILHRNRVVDACEPGLGGVPVETVPGGVVAPGTVIPAPAATEDVPSLEAIPPGSTTSPTQGSNSGAKKTLFETYKPQGGTTTSRLSPRAKPQRDTSTATRTKSSVPPAADDPLMNLPPISAGVGQSGKEETPPAAPTANEPQPAENTTAKAAEASAADANPPTAPDQQSSAAAPAQAGAAPAPAAELPPKAPANGVSMAPGIDRFKPVEPQLAGGSLPTAAGWAFLIDKGYRTVLDLRDRSEVKPADVAAADHAGLRYVALPITPETIDAAHIARFQEEITLAGSRPLFFFDADGSRASVLWYLRLVTIDKRDPKDAAQDAEEVGPKDPKYWLAAATYLESLKPAQPAAPAVPAAPAPAPAAQPESPKPTAALDAAPSPAPGATAKVEPQATASSAFDSNSWRPYVAMLVAALGVPIAYFGRSALSFPSILLASLPGPARRSKSLPAASGE
jgi:protein tyrosine phosphatase (PTP) superfamily phosphohydrolase (DUF442 family)